MLPLDPPPNPRGYIPDIGQGLPARESQEGTDGGMNWLKRINLHKYWPAFSHWPYDIFMSLTEETIDERLAEIGARDVSHGAKKRLSIFINYLRMREIVLKKILKDTWSGELHLLSALNYLQEVVHTPLPSRPGSTISVGIVTTVVEVLRYMSSHRTYGWKKHQNNLLTDIYTRSVLRRTYSLVSSSAFQVVLDEIKMSTDNSSKRNGNVATATAHFCWSHFQSRMPTKNAGFSEATDIWHKPSSNKKGIWPQGENVSFNIWSTTIFQDWRKELENLSKSTMSSADCSLVEVSWPGNIRHTTVSRDSGTFQQNLSSLCSGVSSTCHLVPPLPSTSLQPFFKSSLHHDIQGIQRAVESLELRKPLPSSEPAQSFIADLQRGQGFTHEA